jgi:hypothetical protein
VVLPSLFSSQFRLPNVFHDCLFIGENENRVFSIQINERDESSDDESNKLSAASSYQSVYVLNDSGVVYKNLLIDIIVAVYKYFSNSMNPCYLGDVAYRRHRLTTLIFRD